MTTKQYILETIKKRPLIIDGAMGTQLQQRDDKIPKEAWEGNEGCNELLNVTAPDIMNEIFHAYLTAGADFITPNTFGSFSWVLDEYNIADRAYELTRAGAELVKNSVKLFPHRSIPVFVLAQSDREQSFHHSDILPMMRCMQDIRNFVSPLLTAE